MSKQKETATSKKVKVVGTEQYVNQKTGQVEDFQVVRMEDRDFNFHKVWLESIINSMDLLGNQKTRLAFWIINNLDRENKLAYTQRQISEKSGISLKTVSVTMKALLDSNFLRRRNGGCYIVNPDILFKGTRNGRLNVLLQYQILDSASDPEHAQPQEVIEPTCEDEEPSLFPDAAAAAMTTDDIRQKYGL